MTVQQEEETLNALGQRAGAPKLGAAVAPSRTGREPQVYLRTLHVDAAHPQATDLGSGTADRPLRTIGAAMLMLRPGDDVVISPGVYREAVVVPALSWGSVATRVRAATPRTVLVKGSDEISGWTAAGNGTYWVSWTREEPQQVYRDGQPLKQIGGNVFGGYPSDPGHNLAQAHSGDGGIWPGRVPGGRAELVDDSFTYDAATRRLYVKTAQALAPGQVLEVSTRRHTFQAESASRLTVVGLDFAHSNTSVIYRWGSVKMVGQFNSLDNLVVRDMDASCVQIAGTDSSLINSTLERCGQIGINGFGTRLTIANNKVLSSNTRGFNKWWEAGGMKLIGQGGLHNSNVTGNVVAYNHGDGIWIDWMNTGNLIDGNTVAYNAGFGIHYEASQTGTISRNVAYGNEMRGIYLIESANCTVDANIILGNVMEGIGIVDGGRSTEYPALKPFGNRVTNNFLAWNDFHRNWVQLVIPAQNMGTLSNNNSFTTELILPRMSVGFMGPANPAFVDLRAWQQAVGLDSASVQAKAPMPAGLTQALAQRRLLSPAEIAQFSVRPPAQQ